SDIVYGDGHIYLSGSFAFTVDFDPGPGQSLRTSNGAVDAFVAKFTLGGDLVWARSFGGSSLEYADRIATGPTGNVIVAGQFRGAADFDPGPGTFMLTPFAGFDIFVSSFDSAGNFQWAAGVGGDGSETMSGLAVDSQGNIFTTGGFF